MESSPEGSTYRFKSRQDYKIVLQDIFTCSLRSFDNGREMARFPRMPGCPNVKEIACTVSLPFDYDWPHANYLSNESNSKQARHQYTNGVVVTVNVTQKKSETT